MTTPINNRFGLNITNPRNQKGYLYANQNAPKGDIRNTYSVAAHINKFDNFLRANGTNYSQFCKASWDAKMMAKEQQMIANEDALNTITSGVGTIFNGIKSIFGL